jgi:hypothetical protein
MGGEESLGGSLAARLSGGVTERLPSRLTKGAIAKALWEAGHAAGDLRRGVTTEAAKTVAFSGHRTRKFVERAEAQLGLA